jgi:hypothetical protein
MTPPTQTPLTQIEALFEELVKHYGDGDDRELRVAAKMLMVALDRFRQYGGGGWPNLVREYTSIAMNDPDKFERILIANRNETAIKVVGDST